MLRLRNLRGQTVLFRLPGVDASHHGISDWTLGHVQGRIHPLLCRWVGGHNLIRSRLGLYDEFLPSNAVVDLDPELGTLGRTPQASIYERLDLRVNLIPLQSPLIRVADVRHAVEGCLNRLHPIGRG